MDSLAYTRQGSGFPFVLVHGYLGGAEMWRDQIDCFSENYDVIAPNLAGFGDSCGQVAPDTIPGFAAQVVALLDSLGIERFHLLGHSMGGMVVQEMAATTGGRIAKLICYGTGPVGVLPDRFETIEQSRRRLREKGLPATAARIAATWFVDGEAADGFDNCRKIGAKTTMQAALASLTAWENWDGSQTLAGITSPTLVLWGDRDRSYGWSQPEALWKGIPNSSLAVVPGCGHNVHMEKPQLFNQLVGDYLMEASKVSAEAAVTPTGNRKKTSKMMCA